MKKLFYVSNDLQIAKSEGIYLNTLLKFLTVGFFLALKVQTRKLCSEQKVEHHRLPKF